MLKQNRIIIVLIVGAIVFIGSGSPRINPDMHGIYTQNVTSDKEIWEHITRGTANFDISLLFHKDEFYVCSKFRDTIPENLPTFRDAYLYPLFLQFKKNNNEIFSGYQKEITIFIHTNEINPIIYSTLKRQLIPYKEMLTFRKNKKEHQGKIKLILTNKQFETQINKDDECFFGLQGGLPDLLERSANISVISVQLCEVSTCGKNGYLTSADYKNIKNMADHIHAQNKKIRIKDIPNTPHVKKALLNAGVDFFSLDPTSLGDQLVFQHTYNSK